MRYAYYPGCSLGKGEQEYDLSMRAVFAKLGIELVELEDWNCCGAVHSDINNPSGAYAMPGRNLALAEAQGFETVITPCSACYKNLRQASKTIAANKSARQTLNASLAEGLELKGNITVLHPLYVLLNEYGLARIKEQVTHPLAGWKVASYYGCMLTRPKDDFDSTERPRGMDDLMRALGAEVIDYHMKAKCCGGALALSHAGVTAQLTGNVLVAAKDAGAEVVSLACPMCHMALDAYQGKAEHALQQSLAMPVVFFTQLLGLALGLERKALGLDRHIVSTSSVR